jgi:hypothetical protein
MNDINQSLRANRGLLELAVPLLARLTDDQYARRRDAWAPIGAQYRHVLEHYQCLLAGLDSGDVDYDSRARDPEVEASRTRAALVTGEVLDGLGQLPGYDAARPLRIQLRTSATNPLPEWSHSTLARELQFLVSHTVHHYALIKLLLAGDGVDLGADFGVAPSTVAHARTLG